MTFSSKTYDMAYFDDGAGYMKYDWAEHFVEKAKYIKETYNPKTVLDVGCAKGFLVKALRDEGINAYGVDISEYAISKSPEEVVDFLYNIDITSHIRLEIPVYDLIVSYDTLEHIPEEKVPNALTFIKDHSKQRYIVVATPNTPDWEHDATHITIKDLEWWKKQLEADWRESK